MLKIALFGVGHLGKFHLNNWKTIEGAEVVGFFDTDPERAAAISNEYAIPAYTDPDSLIDVCDAADIVTPTPSHFLLCANALKKGKHVFVEKPLTENLEEARELMKLVKESNLIFQVGHVERFNPAFRALQGQSLKPMFIEVHRLAQFNPRGTDVSVILDLMIHDIDIILHLVKSNVSYISANGVSVMSDTPDIANVRIEFDNGCVANLTSSRISMKKMRKIRLFQKDAYISIDFLEKKTEIIRMDQPIFTHDFQFEVETAQGKRLISVHQPPIEDGNAIRMELEAFRDAILQHTEPPVGIIDGYRALEVAHQILEKIAQHHH